jgi:hypothetical protein
VGVWCVHWGRAISPRGRDRVAATTEDQQRPAEVLDELDQRVRATLQHDGPGVVRVDDMPPGAERATL